MLAVMAYLRANDFDGPVRHRWLAATFLCGLSAILSKPVAITLPAILLILDVYPLRRIGPGRWFGTHTLGPFGARRWRRGPSPPCSG